MFRVEAGSGSRWERWPSRSSSTATASAARLTTSRPRMGGAFVAGLTDEEPAARRLRAFPGSPAVGPSEAARRPLLGADWSGRPTLAEPDLESQRARSCLHGLGGGKKHRERDNRNGDRGQRGPAGVVETIEVSSRDEIARPRLASTRIVPSPGATGERGEELGLIRPALQSSAQGRYQVAAGTVFEVSDLVPCRPAWIDRGPDRPGRPGRRRWRWRGQPWRRPGWRSPGGAARAGTRWLTVAVRRLKSLGRVGGRQQHDKFLAAVARHHVVGTNCRSQDRCRSIGGPRRRPGGRRSRCIA